MTNTEILNVYKENVSIIQYYLKNTFLPVLDEFQHNPLELFTHDSSLYKIYSIDATTFQQNTPSILRDKKIDAEIGRSFKHFFDTFNIEGQKTYLTHSFLNEDDELNIKLVCYLPDKHIYEVYSFNLLKIIEINGLLNPYVYKTKKIIKIIYFIFAGILSVISLFLAALSIYIWGEFIYFSMFGNVCGLEYQNLFHGIVSLTLGLAIFDLSKSIFVNEILYKKVSDKEDTMEPHILINFIGSIIIALLIESLLIVFKSSFNEFKEFNYGIYLIGATGFLTLVLSFYIYMNAKAKNLFSQKDL